ncbi:MAG: glycosyltransferase family 39 protein [Bacteroidota bacterium]|nr:glycosyltransferase family 39 protein [Bacteroidota bacterium]
MFDPSITKNRVVLSAIIVLFVLAMVFSLNQFFLYTPDSARYVAWANSLSQFNGFTDATAPEAKRYMVHSPLYSLLLAPIAFVFPNDIVMLKMLNILLSAITVMFLFRLMQKQNDTVTPFLVVAMFVLHPMVYILSTQILTEILFGCGLIALLYFLQNELQENSSRVNFILTMISLMVCVFSREVGVLCVPVIFFFYLFKKSYTKTILVFFIPLILYGVWFIRNEIYYANVEQTEFKNSLVFFSNTMTSSDTNFGIEMLSRLSQNVQYYLKEVTIIVFTPVYDVFHRSMNIPWMALVDSQLPVMNVFVSIVNNIYWILSIISICLVVAGMIIEYLYEKTYYIKMVFFALYVGIVLMYPVLDSRFLYPIYLLFLLWIGSTLSFVRQLNNRVVNLVMVGFVIVLIIPNAVWTINFIDTQHRLVGDPLGTFLEQKDSTDNVKHFQIALPMTGEWLNKQNDSSLVVLSPYKELAFYLKNKKVFVLNRIAPTSTFNQVVQDYNVHYVVVTKDIFGWRDYEIQFESNKRYAFQLVFDSGSINIYKVLSKTLDNKHTGKYSPLISEMKNKNYAVADSYFIKNRNIVIYHADLLYLNILNKHYQGQLDSVTNLLERLYAKPQGLAYTKLASIHQTLISRRALLDKTPFSDYRSSILMNLGITYWQIDMRDISLKYYQQCIEEDSTVALAYVFRIIFSIQENDTASAIKVYRRMQSVFPTAELTRKIDTLMGYQTKYRKASSSALKAEALEGVFDMYHFLGFTTTAIEIAQKGLGFDPDRISLYKKLGILYEREYEYFPALMNLNQYVIRNNNDSTVNARIIALKQKLYIKDNSANMSLDSN